MREPFVFELFCRRYFWAFNEIRNLLKLDLTASLTLREIIYAKFCFFLYCVFFVLINFDYFINRLFLLIVHFDLSIIRNRIEYYELSIILTYTYIQKISVHLR